MVLHRCFDTPTKPEVGSGIKELTMPQATVVIVGAGASGLSAAAALKRHRIESVLLDQDAQLGDTWARRYDRLHLHTTRAYSGLAHYAIPHGVSNYPSRDEYVAYLRGYADHFGLRVLTNYRVQTIRAGSDNPAQWQVCGVEDSWQAPVVVVATGQYRIPRIPAWPGLRDFGGELIHSSDYKNATAFVDRRVLVVGAGNTGAEIATDLIEQGAAFVAISIRTPPPIVPRDPFGMPVQRTSFLLNRLPARIADRVAKMTARIVLGDLSRYGLPAADWLPYSARRVPVIDVGFVRELKQGRIKIRPELMRLTATQAIYGNGGAEPFDAIIAATGFTTGLDSLLENTAVLDDSAEPADASGEPTLSAGLYFLGYTHSLRGHLFEANRDSHKLAANVDRYLRRAT
jgi:putative flavoprotein involved in K+ transport